MDNLLTAKLTIDTASTRALISSTNEKSCMLIDDEDKSLVNIPMNINDSAKLNIAKANSSSKLLNLENTSEIVSTAPIDSVYIDLPVLAQNAKSSLFRPQKRINARQTFPHQMTRPQVYPLLHTPQIMNPQTPPPL